MRLPWRRPKPEPSDDPLHGKIASLDEFHSGPYWCEFCRESPSVYRYARRYFCSRWCINYFILNGNEMASTCDGCGWRGCAVDFITTKNGGMFCTKGAVGAKATNACWQGVTDEEFEEYRMKILEDLHEADEAVV